MKKNSVSKDFLSQNLRPLCLAVSLAVLATPTLASEWSGSSVGGDFIYTKSDRANDYTMNSSISLGALVEVGTSDNDPDRILLSMKGYGTDWYKWLPDTIAFGTNAYARTGTIQIGSRTLAPNTAIGDTKSGPTVSDLSSPTSGVDTQPGQYGLASTAVGTNSFANGLFTTTYGSFNIQSSQARSFSSNEMVKNSFATVIGTFNSNESYNATELSSGVGNFIGGVANRVNNSNGSLVIGGGNVVENSSTNLLPVGQAVITAASTEGSPLAIQNAAIKALSEAKGGSVLILGSGNQATNVRYSQITGVKNTIKGTSEASETVSVSGLDNTVEDSSKVFVVGNNRTVKSSSDTIAVGFNSSDSAAITTTAKQAVILGSDANVTKDGGIALGYKSIASTAAGVAGYDPETGVASTKTDATWTSTAGAVSIGADNYTRQITDVAAGTQDTDAVNVAQLKAALTKAMSNSGGNNGGNTGGDTGNTKTVKVTSSDKNLTVTPTETDTETTYDLALNSDKLTLGTDTSKNQVVIEGNSSTITVGTGANQVKIDGGSGNVSIGSNISMNAQTGGANFGKVTINEGNKATIGGLSNTTWNPNNYVSGLSLIHI